MEENFDKMIIIDVSGKYVMLSFIDIYCYLWESGFEYKEDIKSGSRFVVVGGFIIICCMLNINFFIDNRVMVVYIKYCVREVLLIEVLFVGVIIKGFLGEEFVEIGFMKEEGVIVILDDGKCVMNVNIMRNVFLYLKDFLIFVILYCEDMNLFEGG